MAHLPRLVFRSRAAGHRARAARVQAYRNAVRELARRMRGNPL